MGVQQARCPTAQPVPPNHAPKPKYEVLAVVSLAEDRSGVEPVRRHVVDGKRFERARRPRHVLNDARPVNRRLQQKSEKGV